MHRTSAGRGRFGAKPEVSESSSGVAAPCYPVSPGLNWTVWAELPELFVNHRADTSANFMLAKRVIPCLDVDRGRVVKGTNFVNLRDAGDPVDVAARYEAEGADELVFLDITASHEERGTMLDVVRRTAETVFMPLTVGGGIRTLEDIRELLLAGSDKVSINTAASQNPEFVRQAAERFGSQCIVVNIDPKRVQKDGREVWEVHTHGGRRGTGLRGGRLGEGSRASGSRRDRVNQHGCRRH